VRQFRCRRLESEKTLGKGISAEEQNDVESVSGKRIPEEWKARRVTREKSGGRSWISEERRPNGEIRGQEELQRPKKGATGQPRKPSFFSNPHADGDVDQKAGINNEHQFVKPNKQIAGKQSRKREDKLHPSLPESGSGKKCHRAYRSKIPGMGDDSHNRRKQDQNGGDSQLHPQ
jgi:hypothetical protein